MITICRANEVEDLVAENDIDAVLSIEHPGAVEGKGLAPRLDGTPQKILSFWDVEDEDAADGPSEKIVRDALDFLGEHEGENVIVHCHAGKSRSVAVVLAWLAFNDGIDSAIEEIKNMRPAAAPNIAIIRIADEILGFDGALTGAVEADETLTANRERTNARRRELAEKDPELLGKLYPEKDGDNDRLAKKPGKTSGGPKPGA